jgi:pimeloyl-ACP methyl ester carboxylesterase
MTIAPKIGAWQPPGSVSREETTARSNAVLTRPDIALRETEDIFRIQALGLDWDMGVTVYEPADPENIARGADGKKIGVFLLHGGSGDFKSMEAMSTLFAKKFGCKAVAMTFPGRLYLDNPSRDWPGDTIHPDGTVRTPIWLMGERITPDQYEVVRDTSMRARYGTRTVARAKPGTIFYDRMAAWPVAFEAGMKDAMRRHFPEGEYSIHLTGHSTGGPLVFMICQRVPNVAGMIAVENSPFGFIQEAQHDWSGALGKVAGFERVSRSGAMRTDPFNELYIRTWRDRARYAGPEALGQEGPQALMRLPWLMEEILDWWDKTKARPQFKAEYIITHNIRASLEAAARAAAARLKMSAQETEALVKHYLGFPYPQTGPGVKPVPPVLFCITKDSRDHSPEVYREVVLPMFAKLAPAPKVHVVQWGAGVHTYHKSEPGLPLGVAPPVAELYVKAIQEGYFVV